MATARTILDHALAAAELGLKVFPLIPLAKRPAHEGWIDLATTDPVQIMQWWRENPNYNYGVATGTLNDIFVVDLDGDESQSWWASQGFPQGAVVRTPSGGRHIYYRTDSTEIQTNKSKIHDRVDIRGEGGLVVGPGSMLPTGTYSGDLSKIPDAPEDLLAIIPERQTFEYTPYEGEQVADASESETRQIGYIVQALQALPRVWHEGAGWHETVYRSACWLSRMVNSGAYALTEDGAASILFTNTPTYPGWGDEKIMEQWLSARKSTIGQYADLPEDVIPDMLPMLEVAQLLPELTTDGRVFTDLLFNYPDERTPGAFWERRSKILTESLRAGLTDTQAASVAWGAKVSDALQREPNGLTTLWREVDKAKMRVAKEQGEGTESAPAEERAQAQRDRIKLLTDKERRDFDAGNYHWWGDRYLEWAATRVSMMNEPYHRMNRWTILSLFFSPLGFIPKKKGPLGLNLFQMVLGETTTGKTEALEIMRSVVRALFPGEKSPDIGGDASPNSLIEKLIERDGKPSWFNADEAHGLFKEMQGVTWRTGLREKWTHLYEGRVPMMLRNGKKDISGIDATTHFVMHLMGTASGMSEVLDAEFWESGFLARYVWAIGLKLEATPESMEEDQQEGDVMAAYDAMPRQWAGEFNQMAARIGNWGPAPFAMLMEPDVLKRHTKFKKDISTLFAGHRQEHLIKPTLIRFANSIRKCATLVAMVEGSRTVTMRHEIIALEQAEEWLTNIVTMVESTTATYFARQTDNLELFILGQDKREVRIERIYRHLKTPKYETDKLIDQLIAEGRAIRKTMPDLSTIISIKGETV